MHKLKVTVLNKHMSQFVEIKEESYVCLVKKGGPITYVFLNWFTTHVSHLTIMQGALQKEFLFSLLS